LGYHRARNERMTADALIDPHAQAVRNRPIGNLPGLRNHPLHLELGQERDADLGAHADEP
jgi:hypothetical protein